MQYVNIYYTVILGWALYYMHASFQSRLPWSYCDKEWNTRNCLVYSEESHTIKLTTNSTILRNAGITSVTMVSASQEYWK